MKKISSRLQERMGTAGPDEPLRVIVTLAENVNWKEGVRQLESAGLEEIVQEETVRTVFGKAEAEDITRMASLGAVQIIEPDEAAKTMR